MKRLIIIILILLTYSESLFIPMKENNYIKKRCIKYSKNIINPYIQNKIYYNKVDDFNYDKDDSKRFEYLYIVAASFF